MIINYFLVALLLGPNTTFAENYLNGLKINRVLDKNTTENELIKIAPESG
jgi:hypothetical protein